MKYWKVIWHHVFTDEPIMLLSEIGHDGYETRKVAEFHNGQLLRADEFHEGRTIGLSEIPVGSIDDVAAQPEFSASKISHTEFEETWNRAVWPD